MKVMIMSEFRGEHEQEPQEFDLFDLQLKIENALTFIEISGTGVVDYATVVAALKQGIEAAKKVQELTGDAEYETKRKRLEKYLEMLGQ